MNTTENDHPFENLLEYLRHNRGFDFTGYKRASLKRRILRHMQVTSIENFSDYEDYLEVHPEEFVALFNTILINVTDFFRDKEAWEYIEQNVIPTILANKGEEDFIRVWSAGCASGEETYTLAILLAEQLGVEAFKQRVKIYATDVDEEALTKARLASYSAREVEDVPEELLEKYFEHSGSQYIFNKELRRSVIFGRHDLIQDAPISRVDLLVCRNILMYFNTETQSKVLARLHFALTDTGYLFLGKAEMLLTHANLFTPVDLKQRIFCKVPRANLRERLLALTPPDEMDEGGPIFNLSRLRDLAFERGVIAQLVMDANGVLVLANERARMMFGITQNDLGQPFQDLKLSYQPLELRSVVDQALIKNEPMVLREVLWPQLEGGDRYLMVTVNGLYTNHRTAVGVNLSFLDVTAHRLLQNQLEHTNQELETAMEELESTNEELETTNEELQSTIEELETTNEELQSTNEELETMNEELQSTNEELETMNDEMTQRTNELNELNIFFQSVLTSLQGSVIVMDQDLQVQVWNPKAEDQWGLRRDEVVGRSFFSLDIGLPVEKLNRPVRSVISGENDFQALELEAVNRRGKMMVVTAAINPLYNQQKEIRGAILIIENNG